MIPSVPNTPAPHGHSRPRPMPNPISGIVPPLCLMPKTGV
nr:MAG TPA: hypothetical protein [Inoviridae sp.]